jgi:hypothetical protein
LYIGACLDPAFSNHLDPEKDPDSGLGIRYYRTRGNNHWF